MLTVTNFMFHDQNKPFSALDFIQDKKVFYFLHFHSSVLLSRNGETIKTLPHALIIYTPADNKIQFDVVDSNCDIMRFTGEIDGILSSVGLHKNTVYYLQDIEDILTTFKKMKAEYYNARPFYTQIIDHSFNELLLKISRDYSNETIIGYKAKKVFHAFDFDKVWATTDSYPVLRRFLNKERTASPVWDGSKTSPNFQNKGDCPENPILINNASELAYVITTNREYKYFKLTADIYLNDINCIDWNSGKPIDGYIPNKWFVGAEACDFRGNIDGDGHIIHGLYYNSDDSLLTEDMHFGAGLIPAVEKADIKNIGIKNSFLKHYDNFSFGAFFGYCHCIGAGSIEGCFLDSSVKLIGIDVGGFIGGGDLMGKKITIKHCYSLAKITGSRKIGAFIGDSWTDNEWTIEDSYCLGKPYGANWKFPELINVFSTEPSHGNLSFLVNDNSSGTINKETLSKFKYLRNKMLTTINEDWSIKRMADEVNFSQSRFYNIYKEIYGVSPITDLINEKINLAKNMLAYGNSSISTISSSLGYNNITHFSRQFKSTTGQSPAEYRKKFKN